MLNQPCETLNGIGPTLAAKLTQCGIVTVQDLLFHLPYRYQDRTRITPIQDVRTFDWCVISGTVCKTEIKQGKRRVLICYIADKTGILPLRFFNFDKQLQQRFNQCKAIRVFGEVRLFGNTLEMVHPDYQLMDTDEPCVVEETLTPIYASTQGLSQTRLRQLVAKALLTCKDSIQALEWMSCEQLKDYQLHPLPEALLQLHNPPPDMAIELLEQGLHPSLKRLTFDELLAQRLSMTFAKQQRNQLAAPKLTANTTLIKRFLAQLPFSPTSAQQRVYSEIEADLVQTKPMLRLVQGDVGSGKTLVAVLAALQAIANGLQVAFMAPTDILSEQHAQTLTAWLQPLGITCHRLSGKMPAKARRETLHALANNQSQLVIGTHALFQEQVEFANLGLVIIDEQHRFGVKQRLLLQQKGQDNIAPHQLLMTATPIPRTLAMTQFAHLDLSTIDELPPGRTPIKTVVLSQNKRELLIERLNEAIKQGRQAYWVCTLIDESETLQCMAATETTQQLQQQLPSHRIGLVHGRLKPSEKETVMAAFKRGELDLLVATTVIEVGVDVPNASLMIIENAERLGLSQLHQLRGRVGRGNAESHCMLLYQPPLSLQASERLHVMRKTNDGFIIAEKDLQLRGSGEFLGVKQTGYRPFKLAMLPRDKAQLDSVKHCAQQLLTHSPVLARSIATRWLGDFEQFLQG